MVFKVVIQPLMHPENCLIYWNKFLGNRKTIWRHRNQGADLQLIAENYGKAFFGFSLIFLCEDLAWLSR
jgi:hypothetical protein